MVSIDSAEGADHEYVVKVNQNLENKNEKKTPPVWIIRLLMLSKSCNKQIRKKS